MKPNPSSPGRFKLVTFRNIVRLVAVLGAGSALGVTLYQGSDFRKRLKAYHEPRAIQILQNPEEVQIYRLVSPNVVELVEGKYSPELWAIDYGPLEVDPRLAQRLGDALLNFDDYEFGRAVACMPNFGVRFSLRDGANKVDVLLCFECGIVTLFLNDEMVGGRLMDGAAPELIAVVQTLLIDDLTIQALD